MPDILPHWQSWLSSSPSFFLRIRNTNKGTFSLLERMHDATNPRGASTVPFDESCSQKTQSCRPNGARRRSPRNVARQPCRLILAHSPDTIRIESIARTSVDKPVVSTHKNVEQTCSEFWCRSKLLVVDDRTIPT